MLAGVASLTLVASPAFAQDPPGDSGKPDSPISPVLQEFIEQHQASASEAVVRAAIGVETRSQNDAGITTKDAQAGSSTKGAQVAESTDTEPGTTDDPVRFDSSGNVQVYIHMENTDDDTLQQLRDLGATIEITNSDWNIVQAWVPITALDAIADLEAVQDIAPPDYGEPNTGRVTTEGDGIHRADLVRAFSGLTGKGVKVGVLSDGVDSWQTARGSRDLPSSIEVDPNNAGSGDEGTALLEIVHDLAPEAELAFSSAGSSLEFAQSILWLANEAFDGEGADVIVDDWTYFLEPYYEDGVIAQAAADAVAGGAVFASAAGNRANKHYTGQFSDDGNDYHDFDGSEATDIALRVSPGNAVILQWNDRFGSSGNDYDLFVCPPGLKPVKFNLQNDVCESSTRQQDGEDDPYEVVHTRGFDHSSADVYIRKYSGSAQDLKLFVTGGAVLEHGVSEGGVIGHPAVTGVLAVGAINAADPGNDEAQPYSDRGRTEIYFPTRETRNKPDVMGIDGVLVTGAGGFGRPVSGVTGNRFFGTSAAAPHVAGIAALVMEAQRKADPSMGKKEVAVAVTQKLKDTAIDLGQTGYDSTFGYGRADARAAIESIATSSDLLDLYSLTSYSGTHTVNSTGDGADDDTTDGVCDDGTVDGSTNCTLRAAIQQTNVGTGATIKFDISGSGTQTISPASALPAVTKPVFIDGYSQTGASAGTVLIELDGTNAGSSVDGLRLRGDGSHVRGLAVNSFDRYGIELRSSNSHILEGNLIGTDTTGATDKGNGNWGVYLTGASDVLLRDNVISGNDSHGVATSSGSRIHVYGNKIGANAAGTADLGNTGAGVHIQSRSVVVRDNVISGNDSHGVHLASSAAQEALVENNRIGTNDAGNFDLGNTGSGIYISASREAEIYTNVIGGNDSHGVSLTGSGTYDTLIAENYIGTNASGADLGNGGSGVHIENSARDNTTEDNTIAYNSGDGVTIVGNSSTGNTVWENSIHVNDGHGIDLGDDGATANDISDTDSGPNHLQNYPTGITFATRGDVASVHFGLYVTSDRLYIVDYYSCDTSSSSEGKPWLGYSSARGSTTGNLIFSPSTIENSVGDFTPPTATHITATATDTETGSTSEFAPCVARTTLPELVISEREVEVIEGSTATYTVRLSSLPSADVTVSLTSGNTHEATLSDATLTFTTTNGTTAQTVTVTGVDDDDADNEATAILHEVSIGGRDHPTAVLPVEVTDNETPALTFASTHAGATFPTDVSVGFLSDGLIGSADDPFAEGTTATYTVVMNAEPDGDVTIDLSSSNTRALAFSPSSITFTKTGDSSDPDKYEWDAPQAVTLTAGMHHEGRNDIEYVWHEVTVGGKDYLVGRVSAVISDPRIPVLTYAPESREVTINSESGTATYTIVPVTQPSSNLTVNFTSSDRHSVTVSLTGHTFTVGSNGNWNTPVTVTVSGVPDDDELDDLASIRHVGSVDGAVVSWPLVQVTVTDGNRAPFFEDGLTTTREVPETAAQGDSVGDPIAATDLNTGDTLTHMLDDPSGLFAIDSSGQITVAITDPPVAQTFDYETGAQDYPMDVVVSDDNGLTDKIEVKVLVANVNEPPVISGDDAPTFHEDASINNRVSRYTAADPERNTFQWSVEGADGDNFTIDTGGNLRFKRQPDFEAKPSHSITIVATDNGDPAERGEFAVTVSVTDTNDPPVITGDNALTFEENTETDTILHAYSATDPDSGITTFTWSLSGTDRGDFQISSAGELTFRNVPNHESPADSGGNNEYDIQVRASDGSLTGAFNVIVTVTNVNEAPATPTGRTSISVAENRTGNLARYAATDPDPNDTVKWDVSGTDADDFTIDTSGNLAFVNAPDHESPTDSGGNNVYEVSVDAKDPNDASLVSSLDVTVTVTPVNEPPTVDGDTEFFVSENDETFDATYSADDPEGSSTTFTWSVVGTDGGDFQINKVNQDGLLTFRNTPDYERPADANRDNEYLVQVRASDGQYTGTLDVTVTVTDVNEPPTLTGTESLSYAENKVSPVATYRASDPERGTITWSLAGDDQGDFNISDGGVLTFAEIPDFEIPDDADRDNEYLVTVVAEDDDTNRATLDVTIAVTNSTGAEEPTITTTSNPSPYRENGTGTVYTFRAQDPQGRAVSWSLDGDDANDFNITTDGGVLAFRSPPDFENPTDSDGDNRYEITVVVTDDQSLTDSVDVVVTVTNHNEGVEPTISTRRPPSTYRENRTSTVYTFRASDPQRQNMIWALEGDDQGDFTLTTDSSGRGVLAFITPPDFEAPADADRQNDYELTVVATDPDGHTDRLSFTITVTDVNEGPEVTGGGRSFTVRENRTWSGASFTASDPEGGAVTRWSLGGRDGGDFTISNDGVIAFRNVPDHERPDDSDRDNVYEVEIRPYDGRYYGSHPITVTVEDVVEITGPDTLDRAENFAGTLATYTASGRGDLTADPTWRLTGTDRGDFTISEEGEVTFRSTPDHERPADSNGDNVYIFAVQASDGRYYDSYDVTVTVTPVNEAPTITTTGSSATALRQNENQTSRLYTYRATDPEGSATITWSVGGVDGGFFVITERGEFSFDDNSPPDYEQPGDSGRDNVYDVLIQVQDDAGNTAPLPVTVMVREVNEGPEVTSGRSSFSIDENQDLPGAVYSGFDPEGGTVTRWAVGGRDGGDFTITHDTVTNEGVLTFRNLPDHERPDDSNRDNVYELEVRPYDGRYYGSFDVTVTVTPVNEPPTITTTGSSATAMTHPENRRSRLYTYRATDPEGATITWSVGGVDARFFAINERGEFSFSSADPPDFEARAALGQEHVYNVTVGAGDGTHTASLPVAVTVTDVNEGPEVTSGPASFTIQENQRLSNAAYTAIDPEGAYVTRWSVGGRDGGDFFITQGGTLYFRSSPDYERPADANRDNIYEVTIQPYDGRNTGSYAVTVTVTDVNEPPEIRRGSTAFFTQPENRATRLYTYSATDPEGGTVVWDVGGTDGRFFTIDERGRFSFREDSPPDFDAPGDSGQNNIYNVNIEARDPQANTGSLPVIVKVTEVNEGPVITRQGDLFGSPSGTVPENTDTSQALGTYTASDPERPSVRITQWSTSGRDGGDFVMNALGELRFRNTPDYEGPADSNRDNIYEVTIRASDGGNTSTLEEVQVVTVTDVNEPPTITTTSRTAFTQPENRNTVLYTFRATDPEGGTVGWTPAGTDGSAFTIDERGGFSFTNPPDFESPSDAGGDNVYNTTIEARDPESNAASLEVTVTVTNHNEGAEPTISTRRPPSTYQENSTGAVYTFRASDPQQDPITWSLTGIDAGVFSISESGALTFVSTPDFENPDDADRDNIYELAVVASDDDGNRDRVDFTITVTNHNEGVEPTISTRRPPSTYRENGTGTVYTFRASDPQRQTISWSLTGTDRGAFTITTDSSGRGVLAFASSPDFENPADADRDNVYQLAVVATDDDSNRDRVDFTITVTDVNEVPSIMVEGAATTTVSENYADTAVLARYTARDPENPGAGIYRWSTSGRDGGDFVVNALGELRFRASPDYERPADSNRDNVYEVIVKASDGRSYGMLANALLVTVTNLNETPAITTRSRTEFTMRENSTSTIHTYRATDQDEDDAIRWSVEGADGEDFAIYNGILTFRLLPDLEAPADADRDNVYEITVVAADLAGLRDTVNATITITDQPEGPVIAGRTSYTVAENYDITQVLGSYTATDAKDGRAVFPQWSLSGRDGGDFVIDPVTGVLAFRSTPDYDRPADSNQDNLYEVTVRGHDSRAYGNLDVMVAVTPINEGAPVVTGRTSHSVRENTASAIHTYRATDPDRGDTIAWSTAGADGHLFQVSERGELSFREAPDFETPRDTDANNVYGLEVVATDGGGLRGTLEVAVTVTALNEGPEVTGSAAFTVNENQDLAGAIYTARDPEAVGGVTTTITWSVSGRDGGDFTIVRETGVLTFRIPPDYERPADSNRDNVYEVTVRAHDGRNYGNFDVEVTVEDVVEITGPTTLDRPENFEGVLSTHSAAGQGILDVTPAWRLTGADRGDFNINEQGELAFRSVPDHERPADANRDNVYTFVVEVSDGSYHGVLEVTVTVTPVNEPPAITGRDSLSFRENTPVTTRLHTYRATDPEGDAFTWGLSGNDAGDFEISEQWCPHLCIAPPDFDRPAGSGADSNEYLVTVQARDDQGNTGEFPVKVTITDQNEGAVVSGRDTIAVQENRDAAITLAAYSATDPEGQVITRWSLVGSDAGDFLVSENGDLTFRNTPDYDRPSDSNRDNEYRVTVRAYDGRTYGNLDVTVTVSNQNEHAPVIRSGSRTSFTYREESTSALYTYQATDGDRDDVITWTTAGTNGNLFEFNDRNGLVFREPPDYENPSDSGGNNEYELTVVATDSGG